MTAEAVTVWNGHRVVVYDILQVLRTLNQSLVSSTSILQDSGRFLQQGAFNVDCESLVVHEKSVYTLEDMKIQVHKQTLYNANLTC